MRCGPLPSLRNGLNTRAAGSAARGRCGASAPRPSRRRSCRPCTAGMPGRPRSRRRRDLASGTVGERPTRASGAPGAIRMRPAASAGAGAEQARRRDAHEPVELESAARSQPARRPAARAPGDQRAGARVAQLVGQLARCVERIRRDDDVAAEQGAEGRTGNASTLGSMIATRSPAARPSRCSQAASARPRPWHSPKLIERPSAQNASRSA